MNIRPNRVFGRSRILTERCNTQATSKPHPTFGKSLFPLFPPEELRPKPGLQAFSAVGALNTYQRGEGRGEG